MSVGLGKEKQPGHQPENWYGDAVNLIGVFKQCPFAICDSRFRFDVTAAGRFNLLVDLDYLPNSMGPVG